MKVSTTGYKRNSKDKKHKQLYIPGDVLTMLGVDDYVQATPVYPNGSYGGSVMMKPGVPTYNFPGAMGVIEQKLDKFALGGPGDPNKPTYVATKSNPEFQIINGKYVFTLPDGSTWAESELERAQSISNYLRNGWGFTGERLASGEPAWARIPKETVKPKEPIIEDVKIYSDPDIQKVLVNTPKGDVTKLQNIKTKKFIGYEASGKPLDIKNATGDPSVDFRRNLKMLAPSKPEDETLVGKDTNYREGYYSWANMMGDQSPAPLLPQHYAMYNEGIPYMNPDFRSALLQNRYNMSSEEGLRLKSQGYTFFPESGTWGIDINKQGPGELGYKQNGGSLSKAQTGLIDKLYKRRVLNQYPAMQNVYGPKGENLNIIRDRNFDASSHGFGDIEFVFPGSGTVNYSDDYTYQSPTPDKYTAVYNPKGAKRGDVFLDMLHGMRDDPSYQQVLQNFSGAVRTARDKDMDYFYDKDVASGWAVDGRETWDKSYIDGMLRAELSQYAPGRVSGESDYKIERTGASPEMQDAARDIYDYLRLRPKKLSEQQQGGSLATAQTGIPYTYYNPDTQSYNRPPEDKNQFVPWDKYMPAFQTTPVEIVAKRPTEEQIQKNQYLDDRQKFTPDETSWYESFNPYNWGVNDYSNYSSFNSAFRNARESGEKEFMFNGERYNTNLVDKKHSDDYWDQKNFLREYYKNEPFKPLGYYDSTTFAQDLIKHKHGTTWLDYYNKREDEKKSLSYDDKRYREIRDSLDMLDDDEYLRDPIKRQELNQYIKSNLGKTELANLEEPYYFSITNNPIVEKDGTTLGFVNPKDKKLFVSTDRDGNLNTTYVHELSHKGDQGDVIMRTPKVDYETLNAFNQGRLDQGMVDYLVNPTEIEARKMSTLYYFKKNGLPYQTGKITSKQVFDLNLDIISHPEKYPSDVVQLFQLFDGQTGKLVKYFNNDFSKKEGGELPKAQKGEEWQQALEREQNRQQARTWDPNQLNGAQEVPTDEPVAVRPMTIAPPAKNAPKKSKEQIAKEAAVKTNKKAQNDPTLWLLEHPEYMLDADGNPVLKASMEANAPAEYLTEQQKTLKEKFIKDRNADPLQQSLGALTDENPQTAGAAERYANTQLAESILQKNPKEKHATRAEWINSLTPQERAIIQGSNKAYELDPSIGTRFARALQTEGNKNSQWQRSLDLTEEEKKAPVNRMDLLMPLAIPAYGVQRILTGDFNNFSDLIFNTGDTPKPYFGDSGTMRDYYQPEAQGMGNTLWQIALDPLNYVGGTGVADEFSKINGPLKNIYKYNPFATKIDDVASKMVGEGKGAFIADSARNYTAYKPKPNFLTGYQRVKRTDLLDWNPLINNVTDEAKAELLKNYIPLTGGKADDIDLAQFVDYWKAQNNRWQAQFSLGDKLTDIERARQEGALFRPGQYFQDAFGSGRDQARELRNALDKENLYPSNSPLGKEIGSGAEGTVYELASDPDYVIKVGQTFKTDNADDLVRSFEGITDNNIATVKRAHMGDNSLIEIMPNLNRQKGFHNLTKEGVLNKLETDARNLIDQGFFLDVDNLSANFKYNNKRNVVDIYDVSKPAKDASPQNPDYVVAKLREHFDTWRIPDEHRLYTPPKPQLKAPQIEKRLPSAQKELHDILSKGFENLTPDETLKVYNLEQEIFELENQLNNSTGTTADAVNDFGGADNLNNTGNVVNTTGTKEIIDLRTLPRQFNTKFDNPDNLDFRSIRLNNTGENLFAPFIKNTDTPFHFAYKKNLVDYFNSPGFNTIMDTYYPNADKELYKAAMFKNLEKPLAFNPNLLTESSSGVHYRRNPGYIGKPSFEARIRNANSTNPNIVSSSGTSGRSYVARESSVNHEYRHQATNQDELLPDFMTEANLKENMSEAGKARTKAEIESGKKYRGDNYYSIPTEFDVRVRRLKEDLKENGIVDYFEGPITEEHINQLLAKQAQNETNSKDMAQRLWQEFQTDKKAVRENATLSDAEKKAEIQKLTDQYIEHDTQLSSKKPKNAVHKNTEQLLRYWDHDFIAQLANFLPAAIPVGIGIGAATQEKKKGGSVNKRNHKDLDNYFAQAWSKSRKTA